MPWAKQQRCGNHVEAIKHLTDLTVVQVAAARERVAAGSTVAGIVTSRVVPLAHCSGQAINRERWGPWLLREVVGEQRAVATRLESRRALSRDITRYRCTDTTNTSQLSLSTPSQGSWYSSRPLSPASAHAGRRSQPEA